MTARIRLSSWCLLLLALACVSVAPLRARADDEPRLRLMSETTEYTDVIDAFDDLDPFDLNVNVGFVRSVTSSTLQREIPATATADGRASAHFRDVASYEHVANTLMLGLDVGVYRDLMVYARLPLVLSDARTLSLPGGRTADDVNADLRASDGGQLFSLPFSSPTRSGLDYLAAGVAWSILNQHRDPTDPTWVVMLEGRFSVGEPMHPCANGVCRGGGEPGMSRGTSALRIESRASWRYRYVQPYAGISFHIEWPTGAEKQFLPAGDLSGIINEIPPRIGELTLGMAIIPWENRERWQRFAVDIRTTAAYVSEGRDYSPLFDALGTSQHSSITTPAYEGVDAMGMGVGRSVTFLGLTDVQAYTRLGARVGLELQAAQYVRFAFGTGLYYATAHMLTFADACNPNVSPAAGDLRRGNCRTGILNPNYRDSIDLAGRRFRENGAFTYDLYVSATAQF